MRDGVRSKDQSLGQQAALLHVTLFWPLQALEDSDLGHNTKRVVIIPKLFPVLK